ncbi:uncharacterized protein ATC70_013144 [Mucor velutinosus]|uniref:Uncharacterized protein n=1 Tax=Mucor velutinosus TaxID=708070 RepID=A0AAN7DRL5_9FUNG|nr:hypothetical protein ATC70_013144 [Mucor velutinosus]
MTIILGTFGALSKPFCLYTYNSYHYFCLDEINTIYCHNNLTKKASAIHRIYKAAPNDFIKHKQTGHIFVMTRTMPHIARLFNCYALAELCKLSTDEILARVAEPLLNLIQCDQWQHALSYHVLVERGGSNDDLVEFESLYGNEWVFTSTVASCATDTITSPPVNKTKKALRTCYYVPAAEHKSPLYRWLSSNVNDLSAQRAKRQQQAIIETRQRQVAFTTTPTKSSKKKIAGQLNPLPLPTSPPTKRKPSSYLQQQPSTTAAKRQKTSCSSSSTPQPLPMITMQQNDHPRIDHGNDNLHLLATQAMQLRGLPPSPSPEPATFKNQRLPSLQTMLSELNRPHHHRVVPFSERRNMDSCA